MSLKTTLLIPLLCVAALCTAAAPTAGKAASAAAAEPSAAVTGVRKLNPAAVELLRADGLRTTVDFYGPNIFRLFLDPQGGILRDPEASPEAQILVDNPRREVGELSIEEAEQSIAVATKALRLDIDKASGMMRITDLRSGETVAEEFGGIAFAPRETSVSLKEHEDEYFYGGGVQNGRFSHKGNSIRIVNTNQWTDGGVASPTPFYWSTAGYGIMWYTFAPGLYDFGAAEPGKVTLTHDTGYLDLFVMVDPTPVGLLNDFYQLTGNPVLIPKFGFYEGHLNAYNRDYWKEDENGILFEDGKRYKESQQDNGGIRESLNGELPGNYPFSARAVIDRYAAHDMPLGWLLPNDGYGAGYGQTATLDGNVENLRQLGEYARERGVEIGLWTQSDLHPKEGVDALLQRDIVKEVRDAGVRVLKTDVAWVGAGYSFGLNGVADVGHIMPYYGNDARPFIISLDGWAGTQRYAAIWSGDQTGGDWEYIRFHIPTYIGSGLSGQPNISSDMDGIFGGRNIPVNVRDFQWKTFTPMQLNMDGWGANPKYPHILGEPAASINRWYLKLKAELMPYAYTIAREAVDGKPMIRAMLLDDPNPYTLGTATRYQFLYGPYLLVAPIYRATAADDEGNDLRDGIYLPEGNWIDFFSGDLYTGGRIINNFDAPLWKLPVFVRQGAILPMAAPHNNVAQADPRERIYEFYPLGRTEFTEYDDDGTTQGYLKGACARTPIVSELQGEVLKIRIGKTQGAFDGMQPEKRTVLRINATQRPAKIAVRIGGRKVRISEAASAEEYAAGENVWYYDPAPEMNRFATPGSEMEQLTVVKNPVVCIRLAATDITRNDVEVEMKGYAYAPADRLLVSQGPLEAPVARITDEGTGAYEITPSWDAVEHADCYEIEFGGMRYATIRGTSLRFEDLQPETDYSMRIRAVNAAGASPWSDLAVRTKSDPLEFAVRGIRGRTSCPNQGGQGIDRLFNFDEGDSWHTQWSAKATPFEMVIDLQSVNTLDRFEYLPRQDAGNGTFGRGRVATSMDRTNWVEAGTFDWKGAEVKVFDFDAKPTARYVRIEVDEAVGGFGSGRELYVFRVPGSESYLPGDINQDRRIDENDLTSYMNYTGLRRGDGDFEGYISKGDLNANGLIDAYDISAVATQIDGGVGNRPGEPLAGEISVSAPKGVCKAGEEVVILVEGRGMRSVNALSFALPYDPQQLEFLGIEAPGLAQMRNFSNDRLHTNGQKALYPTFVNVGEKPLLEGDMQLMVIRFRARIDGPVGLEPADGLLVDRQLNQKAF